MVVAAGVAGVAVTREEGVEEEDLEGPALQQEVLGVEQEVEAAAAEVHLTLGLLYLSMTLTTMVRWHFFTVFFPSGS